MPFRAAKATLAVVVVAAAAVWTAMATFGPSARPARGASLSDATEMLRLVPPRSRAAVRGREVAMHFGLTHRFEMTLQVNNAFSAQNRRAIARVEGAIAAIPGVWRVAGPAGLLAVAIDGETRSSSGPLLAGGANDEASEAVRQRLIRRSDAIGWFVSRDGTEIRLQVDTDNLPAVRGAIEGAVVSSGLVLLSGGVPASMLWPEPTRPPYPFVAWLPFLLLAATLVPVAAGVAFGARPGLARAAVVVVGAAVATTAPAALAPAAAIRDLAALAGALAATLLAALMVVARLGRTTAHASPALGPRPRITAGVSLPILIPSALLLAGALAVAPRLSMGTQLWRETPMFFVGVRGDMDEPVVLREVRRLTDYLRAEPGVAHAWSIADFFFAVPEPGEGFGGIPASPELVRSILTRARDDSAVRLELAPDHRTALVGVRLDDQAGVDRLTVLDHLRQYLEREQRAAVLRVDLSDSRVSPAMRGLAKGILAADARERVLRICERSGRMLSDSDVQNIEQAMRRATLVPAVEPAKLKAEVAQEVSAFAEQVAIAAAHVGLPRPADRQRVADELAAEPVDATVSDVMASLRTLWDRRLPEPVLRAQAIELRRRLIAVRRFDSARINFNDVLYGADLPTEGVLSEEVRDATLDAMGPIAAVPVGRDVPGAFLIDVDPVGGVACDRALSAAWLPRLGLGILIAAALLALLLLAVGGLAGLGWWPVALAPAAPLIIVPAVAGLPIGALYVVVLAGALAAGATLSLGFAPARTGQ